MECRVSAFSRAGGREHNEDACGYMEKGGMVCCVLADGAGGHRGGEVASRICVQSVFDKFMAGVELSATTLNAMLQHANQAVLRQQQSDAVLADMRATLVVLLFDTSRQAAVWGHIGDSRLYLLRKGRIHVRTHDHSLVQSMVDGGILRPEEAHGHTEANILFSSIGLREGFVPTVLDAPMTLCDGDALLLCSDGIWSMVSDMEIEQCLCYSASLDDWLRSLEKKVSIKSDAGSDNYSAVAVWCGSEGDFLRTVPLHK